VFYFNDSSFVIFIPIEQAPNPAWGEHACQGRADSRGRGKTDLS
jgi:hypothetical protein